MEQFCLCTFFSKSRATINKIDGEYDYVLPANSIALKPASPRDHTKLFVYDTAKDSIVIDRFYNLHRYLPTDSFLVLNNTKVLPARVLMKKETGGNVVVLFLPPAVVSSSKKEVFASAIVDRKIKVGQKIFFDNGDFFKAVGQKKHIFNLKSNFSKKKLYRLLKRYGSMPIPLYLKRSPLKRNQLLKKYQTVFARRVGSAAAPTASLHFTHRLFKKLKGKGIKNYFVTLHVGLGTFAPVTGHNLKTKTLHEEYFEVERLVSHSIFQEKNQGKKLTAVGTTVVRTLESHSRSGKTTGKTNLFIYPPYNFKMVDQLITNFHLPKSSLIMLVEAFLKHKKAKKGLIELYDIAIKNKLRFYSFGDAMLIL